LRASNLWHLGTHDKANIVAEIVPFFVTIMTMTVFTEKKIGLT